MRLDESFFQGGNVTKIASELLGKVLVTCFDGVRTSGMIVETEAYSHRERGCHAYGGKKTKRNEVMFEPGGLAYVYLCYGVHHLFNVVTNQKDKADAVLIRAIQPMEGIEMMKSRMNTGHDKRITSGPGKLTKALGIDLTVNGMPMDGDVVWVEHREKALLKKKVLESPRIGIDYAGDDAKLLWRFSLRDNEWVSR